MLSVFNYYVLTPKLKLLCYIYSTELVQTAVPLLVCLIYKIILYWVLSIEGWDPNQKDQKYIFHIFFVNYLNLCKKMCPVFSCHYTEKVHVLVHWVRLIRKYLCITLS